MILSRRNKIHADQEKRKRQQMVQAKINGDNQLPKGFFSPELENQIKQSQLETMERTSSGGILKKIFVCIVLLLILGIIIVLWRSLNETEKKFKD